MAAALGDAEAAITIVIPDDHPILRTGVRELLGHEDDLAVLAEADDVATARGHVREQHPDVLVIDLNMPGESVLDALPGFRSEFPETEIVVLTMQNEPAYALRALRGGALGYVLKDAAGQELVTAVRAAARHDSFLNPRLGARIAAEPTGHSETPGGLSGRELEVITMLALGHTNAQIGEKLHISVRTAETHRAHIHRKLAIRDRQGLVQFAMKHRLISTTPAEP
jgi:two-component system response regulator NreC